jgi:hypothetical protein
MEADAKDGLYKQQTSVEWFISKLPTRYRNAIMNDCKDEIMRAKEMDKERIIDAYNKGYQDGEMVSIDEKDGDVPFFGNAEQYYNKTYGGSNEKII